MSELVLDAAPVCCHCGEPRRGGAHGRCHRCDVYWRRHGYDRPPEVDRLGTRRPCQTPGCGTRTRALRRGYCGACYWRQWKQTPAGQAYVARDAAQRRLRRAVARRAA